MTKANYQRVPIQPNLQAIAMAKAKNAINSLGMALPCSVVEVVNDGFVKVNFEVQTDYNLEQLTLPKLGTEWIRYPTQKGDFGFVIPSIVSLAGVTGVGQPATMRYPGNFAASALVFAPLGNANWSPQDKNAVVLYGPDGCVLKTLSGNSNLTVGPNGISAAFGTTTTVNINGSGIALTFGGHSIVINSSGVTIDGVLFDTHEHLYTPGTGTPTKTGGPTGP